MAAAEELRLPIDRTGSRWRTPMSCQRWHHRGQPKHAVNSPLVRRAAAAARELLLDTAAQQWAVPRERITMPDPPQQTLFFASSRT